MQLKEIVIAPDGENIEVSTLTTPNMFAREPETCLFFEREHNGRMSNVVETYIDYHEAVKGHEHWVDKVRKEGLRDES